MNRIRIGLVLLVVTAFSVAARADVHDNAKIFSADAVKKADDAMASMEKNHKKQFVVETFAAVPDDQKDAVQQQGKDEFFKEWMASRAKELKVNGVYALVCMDPKFIEVGAGQETRNRKIFVQSDIDALRGKFQTSFKAKEFDQGLADAVDYVERTYTANIGATAVGSRDSDFHHRNPAGTVNRTGQSTPVGQGNPMPQTSFGGFGTWICLGVGVIIVFSIVSAIFRRNQSGYGGQGYGGGQGGGPGIGGAGYGQGPGYGGGGYGGGGGGGFGRGLLGGLLGGAVGGYAADRFMHRNDNETGGGGNIPADGGGASGGSFDSGSSDPGPSDAGQGFGDSSSGGGFDSGGGGGDSGGSSGGDF